MISFCILTLVFLASCAKLPMENDAPGAPIVVSDGVYFSGGVEVLVTVDDPDGDMVTLHFLATNPSGLVKDFTWSSFVASGEEESFFLGIGLGQWTLKTQARDELDELSPTTSYDFVVSFAP